MELLKAIVLGIVQGATEFLPVSSSGHLVLGSHLLGFQEQGLVFDVVVHLGTLFSLLIVFRSDLHGMVLAPLKWLGGDRSDAVRGHLAWDGYVIIATVPAVLVGLTLKSTIEELFSSLLVVYLMLLVTGTMMVTSRFLQDRGNRLNYPRALLIGCAQAFAILPGLSRSGSTIFTGMLLGVNRETVARFSFIMSIPAILGAAVLNLSEVVARPPAPQSILNLFGGMVMAGVTGYLAIVLLLDLIRKNRLPWFGYYCFAVAITGLISLGLAG